VLWATQGFCAKKKPPAHPVNLNTASSAELQQVPGIGPATADKILQTRKSYGKFKSVDDLEAIRGIGPKRLNKMRKYLTVGAPAAPANKTTGHATAAAKAPPPKNASLTPKPTPKPRPPATASDDEEP
jgi:competence ComEA-like helix-hairpin-helix protein